jgi:hypothetical protein
LFWNIVVTHLLSVCCSVLGDLQKLYNTLTALQISAQCPSEKKKLYGMLAFKQIERAAQAAEQVLAQR